MKTFEMLNPAWPKRVRSLVGVNPISYQGALDEALLCYHLDNYFLPEFAADIRGHCLEFEEDRYTSRLGGAQVTQVDVLHVDDTNPRATIIADLTQPNDIPSNTFDCIICTYVLHVIFDVIAAIREMHRILKPGGVLLVTVPHISPAYTHQNELWRFTPQGLERLLSDAFGSSEQVTLRPYGNSLVAMGTVRGLLSRHFTEQELAYIDTPFATVLCARAIKVKPE